MDPLSQTQDAGAPMGAGPAMGDAPLDPKGLTAVTKAVQGAVASVMSILQPGEMTHDQVIDKVIASLKSLKKPGALGGMGDASGLGDMESMAEDAGGESESGAGE